MTFRLCDQELITRRKSLSDNARFCSRLYYNRRLVSQWHGRRRRRRRTELDIVCPQPLA
jgi:hypothetical protein